MCSLNYCIVLTMSSIFRILRTVSVARVIALTDTRRGCTTSSSKILVTAPWNKKNVNRVLQNRNKSTFRTLMPAVISPWAWRFLNSVTVAIELSPAFSARVKGMISRASAYALKQYASTPVTDWACSDSRRDSSVSGAPPPAIRALQFNQGEINVTAIDFNTVPLSHETPDDAECIVQWSLRFSKHQLVAALDQNCDRSASILNASNFHNFVGSSSGRFFHEVSTGQVFSSEVVQTGNGTTAQSLQQ